MADAGPLANYLRAEHWSRTLSPGLRRRTQASKAITAETCPRVHVAMTMSQAPGCSRPWMAGRRAGGLMAAVWGRRSVAQVCRVELSA